MRYPRPIVDHRDRRLQRRRLEPDRHGAAAPVVAYAVVDKVRHDLEDQRAVAGNDVADLRVTLDRQVDAGFDRVELHGANGYLVDQFIQDGTNRRTDA